MKFILALLIGVPTIGLANEIRLNQYITCDDGEYSIALEVDKFELDPPKTAYTVYKNNKLVKSGSFQKSLEAYEGSFLKAYIWEFNDKAQNSIGIATQAFKSPQKGTWPGKADVLIDTDEGSFESTSIDCEIEIN